MSVPADKIPRDWRDRGRRPIRRPDPGPGAAGRGRGERRVLSDDKPASPIRRLDGVPPTCLSREVSLGDLVQVGAD